jgi:hypothetical protein
MNPTQLEELEERLRDLNLVVKVGQGLLFGAFGLGVWVTTIQIRINSHEQKVEEVSKLRTADVAAIRALELKDSADTQLLRSIVEKLDKIDRKLNP